MFAGFVVALSGFAGCDRAAPAETTQDPAPLNVVCTVGMVTDIVANVAGKHADVVGLLPSGIDPHLYSPTRSDVGRILDADIVFYNGLFLEGKMIATFERASESGKPVIAVTERIDPAYLLTDPEGEKDHDPHVWMDPQAWTNAVAVVRDALIAARPEHAEAFTANAADFTSQLNQLDEYASTVLTTVPKNQRVLITAHDAFEYFGSRFGFEVVGIQGISTQSEAGVRRIEQLVDLLVERQIPAVFIETTVSERNINALITGAKARGLDVAIGGELFSDAMGPDGTYEGTYIGMIDHNVTTIARALGGSAPARGMRGSLAE